MINLIKYFIFKKKSLNYNIYSSLSMENNLENNNKQKDFYYIYFIESHKKNNVAHLSLAKKIDGVDDLEVAQILLSNKDDYLITIYKCRIYSKIISEANKNYHKFEFVINLLDNNKEKFKKTITNIDINKNNFLFEFKFANAGLFNKILPPKSLQLSLEEYFNYYLNYIKDTLKCTKESEEINDLIISVQKVLEEKNENYNFNFYLKIFVECQKIKTIQNHLNLFKIERINIGQLDIENMNEVEEIFNSYIVEPNKININNNPIEEIYQIKLFILILFYYYNFKSENVQNLYDNKNINKYIYKGLLKYTTFFKKYKLANNQIHQVINYSNNFNELRTALKYCSNTQELLQLIDNNLYKFNDCFLKAKDEYQKKNDVNKKNITKLTFPLIELADYVIPTKDDNLNEIFDLIKKLENSIKMSIDKFYLIFDSSFFKKYIEINKNKNLDNLLTIQKIMNLARRNYNVHEEGIDINKYIHDTGMKLSDSKKLNNIQIFNFVKNDSNYKANSKFIKERKCLDVFDGLDISSIGKEEKEICKTINWFEIFGKEYIKFVEKISSLINHINDFNKLFIILNINIKEFSLPKEYADKLFVKLQDKYFDLKKTTYEEGNCPNFINDTADLIHFTDNFGNNIDKLLSNLNKEIINEKIIYEIYMRLLTVSKELSETVGNKIAEFLLDGNKNNKKESYLLLYLLERCKNSKKTILSFCNYYLIEEKDILQFNESENLKLISGLINNEIFSDREESLNNYFNHCNKILDNVKERIEKNEIKYNELEEFFDSKNDQKLSNRLLIIYLNDEEKAEEKMKKISEIFNHTKSIINQLEKLKEYKAFFFPISQKNEKEKLDELAQKIKISSLNYCNVNKDEINRYLNQLNEEVEERINKKNNLIYSGIYKKEKESSHDENIILEKSNEKFNEFKSFLLGQDVNKTDMDLTRILKSLNLNKELVFKISDELMTLYNIKENFYRNKIINSLMSLSYKDKIKKIISSLTYLIDATKVKKGYFYDTLKIISSYMEKGNLPKTINMSIKILKAYSIDILDENDSFIKLYINSEKFPLIIQNYLLKNLDERTKGNSERFSSFLKAFDNIGEFSQMKDIDLIKKIIEETNKSRLSLIPDNNISIFNE